MDRSQCEFHKNIRANRHHYFNQNALTSIPNIWSYTFRSPMPGKERGVDVTNEHQQENRYSLPFSLATNECLQHEG